MKNAKKNSAKNVCIILMVVFTLIALADIINLIVTPAQTQISFAPSGFTMPEGEEFQMPESGDFPMPEGGFEMPEDGSFPSFEGRPETAPGGQGSFLSTVRRAWLPILIASLLGDGVCLAVLLRLRKKEKAANTEAEDTPDMPMLEPEEDPDDPPRRRHGRWVIPLCLILVAAIVLSALPASGEAGSSATVQQKVLSGTPEAAEISTVLTGAGTLEADAVTAITVPEQVKVLSYHVRNGETVTQGDPLVSVDKTSAASAMIELQDILKELDADLEEERQKEASSYLSSTASGRVKKIYARVGEEVADVLYEDGALMLLSLDGLMEVTFNTDQSLSVGEAVTVTLSDGTQETGKLATLREGKATVTISDETAPYGDSVTVTGEDGKIIGSGTLAIHSELKVIGYYGTVDSLSVSVNDKVSTGTRLMVLEDTGHTAAYQLLLARRQELEEQMTVLSQLAQSGKVYADSDGIVSGVPDDADIQLLSSTGGYRIILLSNTGEVGEPMDDVIEEAAPADEVSDEDTIEDDATDEDTSVEDEPDGDVPDDDMELTTFDVLTTDNDLEEEPPQITTEYYAACIEAIEGTSVTVKYMSSGEINENTNPADYLSQMSGSKTFTLSLSGAKPGDFLLLLVTNGESATVVKHVSAATPEEPDEPEPPTALSGSYAASLVSASGGKLYIRLCPTAVSGDADLSALAGQMTQVGDYAYTDSVSGSDIQLTENGTVSVVKLADLKENDLLLLAFQEGIVTSIIKAQRTAASPETPTDPSLPSGGEMSGMGGAMSGMTGGFSSAGQVQTPAYEQYIVAEKTLLSVSGQTEVQLTIQVDELDILTVKNGLEAQVTLDAMKGQSFTGTIKKIDTVGTNDGGNTKFAVTVTLPREKAMLDGMNASVKIITRTSEAAVTIPAAALVEDGGKTYVSTAYDEDEDVLGGLVEVETGVSDGELVEILSGLSLGDSYYYRYADTVTYSFLSA